MSSITGVVERVTPRSGVNKKGKSWKVVNIKVNGDWYGAYTDKVPEANQVEEGDTVVIEWSQNGNFKDYTSMDITAKAEKVKTASGGEVSASAAERNWHITLGGALHDAASVVNGMVSVGAIELPAAKNKKYDAYLEYVKAVALDLATFNINAAMPEIEEEEDATGRVEEEAASE